MLRAQDDATPTTRVIPSITSIIDRYDGFIVDGFGTLHYGSDPAQGSSEALHLLVELGKAVVVVVNSSDDHGAARAALADRGVRLPDRAELISSSGLAYELLSGASDHPYETPGTACLMVGRRFGSAIDPYLPYSYVDDPMHADFVLISGIDPKADEFERQRQTLTIARLRDLPMICTNPDMVVLETDWLGRGPGSLARSYERSGGQVHWIGKPHAVIYRNALRRMGLPADRVVAIGDDIDVDIAGSLEIGVDTLLLTAGAHYDHFRNAISPVDFLACLDQLRDADRNRHLPQWLASAFRV
ncbi:MAG: TIGR01459 family HAD-type hydrolase [Pseudomonadota bacterium]